MLNKIDLSRVDLNLLMLFEVVLEQRHVARSAEVLNLSPSAISHGLKRLRALLNDPLFLKTPKGLCPPPAPWTLAVPIVWKFWSGCAACWVSRRIFDPARTAPPVHHRCAGCRQRLAEYRACWGHPQDSALGIDISVRQIPPPEQGDRRGPALGSGPGRYRGAGPGSAPSSRSTRCRRGLPRTALYEEDFVIAMRSKHPFQKKVTLENYCAQQHLVVFADPGRPRFCRRGPGAHRAQPAYPRRRPILCSRRHCWRRPISSPRCRVRWWPPMHRRFGLVSVAPLKLRGFTARIVTAKGPRFWMRAWRGFTSASWHNRRCRNVRVRAPWKYSKS